MKRIPTLTGIALAALTLLPLQLAATPISTSLALDTVFSGNTPDGPAPWLIAGFTSSIGSNTGTLLLSSHTSGPDFIQGLSSQQSTVGWAFYLNQALSPSGVTCTAGTCADQGASYKASGFNTGPVPGIFNLAFGWSQDNRFMIGDSATYTLTFANPLTGNPFVENDSNWSSVAHIQGIVSDCSGWIVSGDGTGAEGSGPCSEPPVTVPEPSELGMLSLGLLFAGLLLGLRRRYN